VLAPHPRAARCTLRAAEIMAEAAVGAGAPEGLISCLTSPTLSSTQELMRRDEIALVLEAGANVVNTALVFLVYPPAMPAAFRERLEAACAQGGTTLFTSGLDPGWSGDVLPLALACACQTVDWVRVTELMDYSTYEDPGFTGAFFGYGRPLDYEAPLFAPGAIAGGWGGIVHLLTDGLGWAVEAADLDTDQVRVPKATNDLDRADFPGSRLAVAAGQEFQRDLTIELRVLREIDDAHPAAADLALDAEASGYDFGYVHSCHLSGRMGGPHPAPAHFAEGAGPVVSDEHARCQIGREADETGVVRLVGGARLARERLPHRGDDAAGAALDHALEDRDDLIGAGGVGDLLARVGELGRRLAVPLDLLSVRAGPLIGTIDGDAVPVLAAWLF